MCSFFLVTASAQMVGSRALLSPEQAALFLKGALHSLNFCLQLSPDDFSIVQSNVSNPRFRTRVFNICQSLIVLLNSPVVPRQICKEIECISSSPDLALISLRVSCRSLVNALRLASSCERSFETLSRSFLSHAGDFYFSFSICT